MTTKTVQINLRTLAAVSIAVSREETRYYLNGVLVQCRVDHVLYVATDGHRMIAVRETIDNPETIVAPLTGDYIIPVDICRAYKPKKFKNAVEDIAVLSNDGDGLRLQPLGGNAQCFKPIDAAYPDWARVVPLDLTGKTDFGHKDQKQGIMYNPGCLADFAKFGRMMEAGLPRLAYNSGDPAAVIFNAENILAVLMPIRGDTQAELADAWAKQRSFVLGNPTAAEKAA